MTNTSFTDVLIVGAGPVGLSLAVDLARRGVAFRIIDQLPAYSHGTRARGVSARTQEVFEDLGVMEQLSAFIEPNFLWRFYNRDGQILRETSPVVLPPKPDMPYSTNVILGQQHTETILREKLESYGMHVELDFRLTGFSQDDEHVTAEVIHAGQIQHIQARYLVGCDGGSSTVRKCADISFLGETRSEKHVMFGNLSVSGLDDSYWHFWTDPQEGLLVSLNPMPHCKTWFFTASLLPDEHGTVPPTTLETFERIFQERIGMPEVHFFNPVYLSIYQLNIRMVNQYRKQHVFLAGDAAHVHSPAGGQGMNTGVQDAYNLGWKLAAVLNGTPATLLDTYQSERLPIARQVLSSTTARTQSWNASKSGDASNVIHNMSNTFQGNDTFGDITQMSVNYRGENLSQDIDETPGRRAGDRAPDATGLRSRDNKQKRLFQLFQGPHFTLLAFSDQPLSPAPRAYPEELRVYTIARQGTDAYSDDDLLTDRDGYAYTAYGVTGNALVLVRPDGYIGLTVGSLDQQAVLDYLQGILR